MQKLSGIMAGIFGLEAAMPVFSPENRDGDSLSGDFRISAVFGEIPFVMAILQKSFFSK